MPTATHAVPAENSFGAALRHSSFRLYWFARVAAWLAGQMQAVAVGWHVYDLTGNPLDLGLVGLFQFLPTLLLALIAGHIVDNHCRRRILAAALAVEVVAVGALFALTLSGAASTPAIFAAVFVIGVSRAFAGPSYQAIIAAIVEAKDLPNAVAWSSSAMQVAMVSGPALGGILYIAGPAAVYGTATALNAVAALLILALRPRPVALARRAMSWDSLFAGLSFIRSRPAILGALSLDMFAVLLGGATALLPVYARDVLDVGPWGLGLLRSAPAIGALVMALALARWMVAGKAGVALLGGIALFGAATVVFGLSTEPVLSFAALVVLGAADQINVFVRQTLIQLATPDDLRGRVGAVSSLFLGASNQLGEFESGTAAAWVGAVPAVVAGGVGAMALAAIWAWRFPALRTADLRQSMR